MEQFKKESEEEWGPTLVLEFLNVVKEKELFFRDKTLDSILEDFKNEKKLDFPSEKQLKTVRFVALSLELFNCIERVLKSYHLKEDMDVFSSVVKEFKISKKEFDAFIKNFRMELVFTAHPTEVFPLPVLKIINKIETLMGSLICGENSQGEQYKLNQEIRAYLTSLWLTDEIYREKPSVEDEANRLFYMWGASLWKSSPYFFRKFYLEYKSVFKSSPPQYPKICYSSWIGGDRDGNPYVTAKATQNIITKSRRRVLRFVLLDLYELRGEVLIKTSQKELAQLYPKSRFPYRALFQDLVDRIQDTLKQERTDDVCELESFVNDRLEKAYEFLCADGAKRIADRALRSLMDRIRTFTFSPFLLDLRQDSEVHGHILKEVQALTGLSKPDKEQFETLDFKDLSPGAREFFQTLQLVSKFKPCPFSVYVISMASEYKDLTTLQTLFKLVGVSAEDLNIVPLFETPEDIRQAPIVIQKALDKGFPLEQVMWGYSDSTKKGGRLASAWNLFEIQKQIVEKFPKLTHFHGRGGSYARGGGETKDVFGLLPAKIVGNHFRQTIQGEVIQDEFGLHERCVQTLDSLFRECLYNHSKEDKDLSEKEALKALVHQSEKSFKKGFYEENDINALFESRSPIGIINQMNLGSRPSKRKSLTKGVSYRAIPWVFAWAQTRGMLPLWYGLQEGVVSSLLKLAERGDSSFVGPFIKPISKGLESTDIEVFKNYMGNSEKGEELTLHLESILNELDLTSRIKKREMEQKLVKFLHEVQLLSLKDFKPEQNDLSLDIFKITAQGIAHYLGRTG